MAKEFILTKQGGLYVADPVPASGKMTLQIGFSMDRGFVKIESSISPVAGWSLISAENAPRIPILYSKVIDVEPGSYVRIITNQLPKSALYLINSSQGGGSAVPGEGTTPSSGVPTEIVESLSAITNPKENVIYLVRNGNAGINVYDEYIYTNSHFELLGGSSRTVTDGIIDTLKEDVVTDEDISNLFKP